MIIPILNLLAYILNANVTYGIGVNGAFGLPTNAELSLKYQTLVTPAGFAFSIWAVIFLSQVVSCLIQFIHDENPLVKKGIKFNYLGVCFSQILWTITFSFEIIWASLIAMIGILSFLVLIIWNQWKVEKEGGGGVSGVSTLFEFWFLKFPFLIHCGWILAATIVNINVTMVKYGVKASDQYGIALLCYAGIVGLAIIALTWRPKQPEFVIPSVLGWASFGIFMELSNPKQIVREKFSEKMITSAKDRALRGTGVILLAIVYYVYQTICPPPKKKEDEEKKKAMDALQKATTKKIITNNKRRSKKEKKSE